MTSKTTMALSRFAASVSKHGGAFPVNAIRRSRPGLQFFTPQRRNFSNGAKMTIGVPKEVKVHEYRVGMVPGSVKELTSKGHRVLVETNAGAGIGFFDADYEAAGADIVPTAADAWGANMVVKVKEPTANEFGFLRSDLTLFTYLHLAAERELARALCDSGCTSIAYETVTDAWGRLPLLAPMSEVAGRLSTQVGAHFLQKAYGGSGVLLGGVPGVAPGDVTIIGGGISGMNAAQMALGLGANVTILDRAVDQLRHIENVFGFRVNKVFSTTAAIHEHVTKADLVIGAVLIPGSAAPKLVTREMIAGMRPGSVAVDIAIDQGGCFETSRPTTHSEPTYECEGVVHYCVTNMPGAVARSSCLALNNVTLPWVSAMAEFGPIPVLKTKEHFLHGLNTANGHVTYKAVAESLGLPYENPVSALDSVRSAGDRKSVV